jgi:hypothetical protein
VVERVVDAHTHENLNGAGASAIFTTNTEADHLTINAGGGNNTFQVASLVLREDATLNGGGIIVPLVNGGGLANQGTVNVTNQPLDVRGASFSNTGLLNVAAGQSVLLENSGANAVSFGNGGTVQLSPGSMITAPSGFDLGGGVWRGTGTINANLKLTNTSVTSHLGFSIGGTAQGSTYDSMSVNGAVTLGGFLDLAFANGFQSSISASQTFTVLSSSGAVTGSFATSPAAAGWKRPMDWGHFK